MSNFVQVNVISHSKNALSSCYEHNVERLKDGEDLPHLLSENDCLGNETITFSHIVVSSGTFEENLRNFYALCTYSKYISLFNCNAILLISASSKAIQSTLVFLYI